MGIDAGLYMYDGRRKITFAISSPDEFLFFVFIVHYEETYYSFLAEFLTTNCGTRIRLVAGLTFQPYKIK